MKNIFKLMGIAVLACGMMVACNKPENEDPNNPDTPDTPDTPTVPLKVTFGNSEYVPAEAYVYTGNYEEFKLNEYMLAKTSTEELPIIDMIISALPGTYTNEATSEMQDGGYTAYVWGQSYDLYNIEYYDANPIQTQSGVYADWQPVTASLTVTSFDINTLKASYTLTATMYDFYSWIYGMVDNCEDADTKELRIVANNFTFTNYSK